MIWLILEARAEIQKHFCSFFEMKTSKFAFEIYWPFCWSLAKNLSNFISLKLENPYNHKFEYPHFHKLYRNLEIPSDSQSADLTDEELNRILRLLINNRKAEPVAEELRRIGGGRRSYGRGSSGKTEGQTVSYLGYITLVYITLGIIPCSDARSVNPIPTGESRLSPPNTTGTPNVFHLPASL